VKARVITKSPIGKTLGEKLGCDVYKSPIKPGQSLPGVDLMSVTTVSVQDFSKSNMSEHKCTSDICSQFDRLTFNGDDLELDIDCQNFKKMNNPDKHDILSSNQDD
jgi:hypothetical protein